MLAAIAAMLTVSTVNAAPIFDDLDFVQARFGNLVIGNEFTVGGADVVIDALGVWDAGDDGLLAAHDVGLWDNSGGLVAMTTVPAGTGAALEDSFRYNPLASNVTLQAGATYRIAAAFQDGSITTTDPFNEGIFGNPRTENAVIAPGFGIASLDGDYFASSTTLVEPTNDDGSALNGRWGAANARNVIPEPTSIALIGLGGIALLATRRRRAS